ncbi:unnamed protein product [Candidula unifasciata]|uniref:Malate dehydrogenase 1B n=1 Tax=Candidula unifasciata TaxID=100452 RepID=A0A8S3YTV0_9EUPU|nr:unnamed protein product [Candidula unifasciata]
MAKIVLAGRSDCPYFARCERLGDRLAKNLQKFKLHKIIIQPHEWEKWLQDTCTERGWSFNKSPIIWRELIDRGGKGVLIGDANDFQEYAKAYYDVEVEMDSSDMLMIAEENRATKIITDQEELDFKALSHPINVCLTNAVSPICYHLLNSLTSGQIFGKNIEVFIRLLVSSPKDIDKVKGYVMEAEDLAHGLLAGISICTSPHEAFEDCTAVILLDSINKLTSESHKDWLERITAFFGRYALIINHKALKNCKILLCGSGPLNIIAIEMAKNAPGISQRNIMGLTTIIENQAKSVVGERLGVNPADIVNLIVWGNIKEHQLLDLDYCRTYRYKCSVLGPPWYD